MASGSARRAGARVANLLHGYIYSSSGLTSASWNQTGIAAGEFAPFGTSMASNQIVRSRMKSVKSFRNVTKAIKMVAASKLRGSQFKTQDSRGLCQPFTTVHGGAPEYRTSSCHGKHYLLESALTEARSSNRIRLSVPCGRGLLPLLSSAVRHISTQPALAAKQRAGREERSETEITTQEDPFDTLTDKIPVQPVSVAEGASYSIAILAGLAVAGAAAYTIFKELIVEPKEYKVYGKALDRVQTDMQVAGRLGSPIHGYGQESQNRAARQRISNRQWVDEDGVEHVEVMFYIRGPGGGGKVFSEMFKDPEDKSWKYTYLIVDVTHPTPKRFLLESYVPEVKVNLSPA